MIYTLDQIKQACEGVDFSPVIEQGFIAYSQGKVVVPPVGELTFDLPPGDTHIKYGYVKDDDCFVIKIASGFYQNPDLGLPSNSGLMLLFSQQTGMLKSILLDEGYLTDIRTAVAGQIAAKLLAPKKVDAIGVLGTGIQARFQVEYLMQVTTCRELVVWGRTSDNIQRYCNDMDVLGFRTRIAHQPSELADVCNLIVSTTPSAQALLTAQMIRPGTHITAMGADTPHKQELDTALLVKADHVVADSVSQCKERGEIFHALNDGLSIERIHELGALLASQEKGMLFQRKDSDITVADLTGVAVQDIAIAKSVASRITCQ